MQSQTVAVMEMIIPILAILVVGAVILIPIAGLTLRFALKPALEAFRQLREDQTQGRELQLLEARVSLLEERVHSSEFTSLLEEKEFRRQLAEGPPE